MQTLKQKFEERNLQTKSAALAKDWRSQLEADYPQQSAATRESIICWLLGKDLERFDRLSQEQLEIAQQAMKYRYRILQQRYLEVSPNRAYRNLTTRLGSLAVLRQKIRTGVALSRDRQRAVVDVLHEVLQELLQSDQYMQQQIAWIAQCSGNSCLRNALLLASTEEYCLRPIRNQPLLVYRFVNYLRRTQRGGLTQMPQGSSVRLISEEILSDEGDNTLSSLLDVQALAVDQDLQAREEQQALRTEVQQEFASYLGTHLGDVAVQWLRLYLEGYSQDAIAQQLKLSVKDVYRLREKISYHAVRVFAFKCQPQLVGNWLQTSLQEHSFGLTPQQWQKFCQTLTPKQQQIVELLKAGKNIEAIAQTLNIKTHQVMGEWSKLHLAAQAIRSK